MAGLTYFVKEPHSEPHSWSFFSARREPQGEYIVTSGPSYDHLLRSRPAVYPVASPTPSDAPALITPASEGPRDGPKKQQRLRQKEWWVADKMAVQCFECRSTFGLFVRRHHCRICGQIYCWRCSDFFLPGARLGFPEALVRVCGCCYSVWQLGKGRFEGNESGGGDDEPLNGSTATPPPDYSPVLSPPLPSLPADSALSMVSTKAKYIAKQASLRAGRARGGDVSHVPSIPTSPRQGMREWDQGSDLDSSMVQHGGSRRGAKEVLTKRKDEGDLPQSETGYLTYVTPPVQRSDPTVAWKERVSGIAKELSDGRATRLTPLEPCGGEFSGLISCVEDLEDYPAILTDSSCTPTSDSDGEHIPFPESMGSETDDADDEQDVDTMQRTSSKASVKHRTTATSRAEARRSLQAAGYRHLRNMVIRALVGLAAGKTPRKPVNTDSHTTLVRDLEVLVRRCAWLRPLLSQPLTPLHPEDTEAVGPPKLNNSTWRATHTPTPLSPSEVRDKTPDPPEDSTGYAQSIAGSIAAGVQGYDVDRQSLFKVVEEVVRTRKGNDASVVVEAVLSHPSLLPGPVDPSLIALATFEDQVAAKWPHEFMEEEVVDWVAERYGVSKEAAQEAWQLLVSRGTVVMGDVPPKWAVKPGHRVSSKTLLQGNDPDAFLSPTMFQGMVASFFMRETHDEAQHLDIPKWSKVITRLAWKAALTFKPCIWTDKEDRMDIRECITIMEIEGGDAWDCEYVGGTVMAGNVVHRDMPQRIWHPRILLIGDQIDYEPTTVVTDFTYLLRGTSPTTRSRPVSDKTGWLDHLSNRVEVMRPDVVLVERSVNIQVQRRLCEAGISLVTAVERPILERIKRATLASIVEELPRIPAHKLQAAGEGSPDVGPRVGHADIFMARKVGGIPLIYICGGRQEKGCTFILRGASRALLARLSEIIRFSAYVAHNLVLECHYYDDLGGHLCPETMYNDEALRNNVYISRAAWKSDGEEGLSSRRASIFESEACSLQNVAERYAPMLSSTELLSASLAIDFALPDLHSRSYLTRKKGPELAPLPQSVPPPGSAKGSPQPPLPGVITVPVQTHTPVIIDGAPATPSGTEKKPNPSSPGVHTSPEGDQLSPGASLASLPGISRHPTHNWDDPPPFERVDTLQDNADLETVCTDSVVLDRSENAGLDSLVARELGMARRQVQAKQERLRHQHLDRVKKKRHDMLLKDCAEIGYFNPTAHQSIVVHHAVTKYTVVDPSSRDWVPGTDPLPRDRSVSMFNQSLPGQTRVRSPSISNPPLRSMMSTKDIASQAHRFGHLASSPSHNPPPQSGEDGDQHDSQPSQPQAPPKKQEATLDTTLHMPGGVIDFKKLVIEYYKLKPFPSSDVPLLFYLAEHFSHASQPAANVPTRQYSHNKGRLTVVAERVPDSEFETKEIPIVWTVCKVCKQHTAPKECSEHTLLYSFGKLLETSFYNDKIVSRKCGHLLQDQVRYFGQTVEDGGRSVNVRLRCEYETVGVYTAVFPYMEVNYSRAVFEKFVTKEYSLLVDDVKEGYRAVEKALDTMKTRADHFFETITDGEYPLASPGVAADIMASLRARLRSESTACSEALTTLRQLGSTSIAVMKINAMRKSLYTALQDWNKDLAERWWQLVPEEKKELDEKPSKVKQWRERFRARGGDEAGRTQPTRMESEMKSQQGGTCHSRVISLDLDAVESEPGREMVNQLMTSLALVEQHKIPPRVLTAPRGTGSDDEGNGMGSTAPCTPMQVAPPPSSPADVESQEVATLSDQAEGQLHDAQSQSQAMPLLRIARGMRCSLPEIPLHVSPMRARKSGRPSSGDDMGRVVVHHHSQSDADVMTPTCRSPVNAESFESPVHRASPRSPRHTTHSTQNSVDFDALMRTTSHSQRESSPRAQPRQRRQLGQRSAPWASVPQVQLPASLAGPGVIMNLAEGLDGMSVIVRLDEPTSIIAYTLCSEQHKKACLPFTPPHSPTTRLPRTSLAPSQPPPPFPQYPPSVPLQAHPPPSQPVTPLSHETTPQTPAPNHPGHPPSQHGSSVSHGPARCPASPSSNIPQSLPLSANMSTWSMEEAKGGQEGDPPPYHSVVANPPLSSSLHESNMSSTTPLSGEDDAPETPAPNPPPPLFTKAQPPPPPPPSAPPQDTDYILEVLVNEQKKRHVEIREFEDVSGSDVKSKSPNLRFACTVLCARQFAALRQYYCRGDETNLIASLSRCSPFMTTGGRTNASYYKTNDGRFMLKAIKPEELTHFEQDMSRQYFSYIARAIRQRMPTVLVKILGVFRITTALKDTGAQVGGDAEPPPSSITNNWLLMENVFYNRRVDRMFDLKGSRRNRFQRMENAVLLDENLLHLMRDGQWFFLREEGKEYLTKGVHNDSLMLRRSSVMDYSLLVGVDDEKKELYVGIIDYMREYDMKKQIESVVKSTGIMGGRGQQPTVIDPAKYTTRFRAAINNYFLLMPSKPTPWVIVYRRFQTLTDTGSKLIFPE